MPAEIIRYLPEPTGQRTTFGDRNLVAEFFDG